MTKEQRQAVLVAWKLGMELEWYSESTSKWVPLADFYKRINKIPALESWVEGTGKIQFRLKESKS